MPGSAQIAADARVTTSAASKHRHVLVPTLIRVSTGASTGATLLEPLGASAALHHHRVAPGVARPTLELRASRLLLGEVQQRHPGEPHAEQDDRAVVLRERPEWRVHRRAVLPADQVGRERADAR